MQQPAFHDYSPAERRADALVHVLGLMLAAAVVPTLILVAARSGETLTALAVAVYAVSLLAMLAFSAAYNLTPPSRLKAVLRRLDHAAIFIMIAGTYTPFAHLLIREDGGQWLIVTLWVLAAVAVCLSVLRPQLEARIGVPLALAMGWSIVLLLRPLTLKAPTTVLVLLVVGGLLYTVGVCFHLWTRLRFHNAIWHVFVLAAAACHAVAVFEITAELGGVA